MPIAGVFGFGYPFEYPTTGFPNNLHKSAITLAPFSPITTKQYVDLWDAYLPKSCEEAYDKEPYVCMLPNFSARYVQVPQFVVQAQSDVVQMMFNDQFPCPLGADEMLHKLAASGTVSNVAFTYRDYGVPEPYQDQVFQRMRDDYKAYGPSWDYLKGFRDNQSVFFQALKSEDGWFNAACFVHIGWYTQTPKIQGKSFLDAFNDWLTKGTETKLRDDCGILCSKGCPISQFWIPCGNMTSW